MPMKINNIRKFQCSSGTKLKYVITCTEKNGNEVYSPYVDIENIVKVRLYFRQLTNIYKLQIRVECQKIEKDINVIVKVSCEEPEYSSERIYREDLQWQNFIGNLSSYDYTNLEVIFNFSITISAYKMKDMVQEKLYNDTEFTDFCLSTAEGTGSVGVHKALLAAHSDVFRAMLSREWKETNEGRIRMEGITLQTLQQLKDYMYLGTLPDDDLLPLWSIASCYLIEDLKFRCLSKLPDIIKPENFYSMLEYSIENKLAKLTFAIIKATPAQVVWDAEKISNEKKVTEETEKE